MLFPACRTAFVDDLNRTTNQCRSQFAWVSDGRRAADKLWIGTVKSAQARQASNDVSQIGTEYPSIGMNFIDNHIFQVFKQLDPFGVVRQNA